MKKINIYVVLLLAMLIGTASCIDDKGNYDYKDIGGFLPTEIKDIPETVYAETHIKLTPTIVGLNEKVEYEYTWYAISEKTGKKSIIAHVRNLDQPLQLANGGYALKFEVRNVEHDIYIHKEVKLEVAALTINVGWYVLKDIDNMTDFDYVKIIKDPDTNEETFEYQRDVLKLQAVPGDSRLKGKALKMQYQPGNYYHEQIQADGSVEILTKVRALHVMTTETFKTFDPLEMEMYKDTENQFYEVPAKINFQDLVYSTSLYLLNNNQLHGIAGNAANVGKMGYSTPVEEKISPFIAGVTSHALYFDSNSSSFRTVTPAKINFPQIFNAPPVGKPSLNKMNADLIALLTRATGSSTILQTQSILKDRTTGDHYILGLTTTGSTAYPTATLDVIPASMSIELPTADVFQSPIGGSFIYFAKGNKVSAHYNSINVTPKEVVVATLPAGEVVSYMGHLVQSGVQYLAILANSPSGWKMYHYKVKVNNFPDLEPQPVRVLSGEGAARHLIYRAS